MRPSSERYRRVSAAGPKAWIQFDGMGGLLARAVLIVAIVFVVGIILTGRFW
jgi:hypothetical protein